MAMRIFLAGATGAIGRRLVPLLVAAGHDVTGTTRHPGKQELLHALGARPAVVDMFDREAVTAALRAARPEAVIHQLTDLGTADLAANGRLRIAGTRNLVDAARAAGVRRMVAQSIAFAYAPGDGLAREEEPLDLAAPPPRGDMVRGVRALEEATATMDAGVILRYGLFYGPGTWYAPDGMMAEQARRRELVADGDIASFVHIDDAARAAVDALAWPPGAVNIVDDEPAPGAAWAPVFARAVGAPPPVVTEERHPWARGAANTRARDERGWTPRYPSWRIGFATGLE
jgi:nucleoside-diphosphate-sugar epimerase